MRRILLYGNGPAGNHGCEAITRSLITLLGNNNSIDVLSKDSEEDIKYDIDDICRVINATKVRRFNFGYLKAYLDLKFNKNHHALDICPYAQLLKSYRSDIPTIGISIGGDNYCYPGADFYGKLDNVFHSNGIKTALVGCSIEPNVLTDKSIVDTLKKHAVIIARESITYNALKKAGLTNVHLVPDPAFALNRIERPLPKEFIPGNTIGINLSPLVEDLSSGGNIVYRNAVTLMEHILIETDMNVCLIPHVIWKHSDDFKILTPLYERYRTTGRVSLIEDSNAEVLKGYISRCRIVFAARTHASIAAYSTSVPTFVLGYSVKSRGIARDIFGNESNYVKSTKDFTSDTELINAFEWIINNESKIRSRLSEYNKETSNKLSSISDLLRF